MQSDMQTGTIVLTGATGFLGSHLLEALVAHGYRVTGIKRSTSSMWRVEHLLEKVRWIDVDQQSLEDAFNDGQVDAVLHTACHYGRGKCVVSDVVETNVLFSLQLLEAAVKHRATAFFNTDSFFNVGSEVQRYMSTYALSKRHFVEWLHTFSSKIKVINIKLQHMYGPKDNEDKFISWLLSGMLSNVESIPLTDGKQKRDFIYVGDVVSAYLHLLEGSIEMPFIQYDVGTGKFSTVRRFVETMQSELEKQLGRKIIPRLGFGEASGQVGEIDAPVADVKMLMSTGWVPRFALVDGLHETIKTVLSAQAKNSSLESHHDR